LRTHLADVFLAVPIVPLRPVLCTDTRYRLAYFDKLLNDDELPGRFANQHKRRVGLQFTDGDLHAGEGGGQ
jgi:hypothetical protein